MKTFIQRAARRLAFAAAAAAGLFVAVPAIAADLPRTVASPGTLYELGSFERRGVLILDGGALEIRRDGCWRSDIVVSNGNPNANTVSVSYRWFGRGGRTIATIHAHREVIGSGERVAIGANGCSGQIARNYGTLSRTQVVRYMSVR